MKGTDGSPSVCRMEKCLAWYEGYNDHHKMPCGTCRLVPGALDTIAQDTQEHEKSRAREPAKTDAQTAGKSGEKNHKKWMSANQKDLLLLAADCADAKNIIEQDLGKSQSVFMLKKIFDEILSSLHEHIGGEFTRSFEAQEEAREKAIEAGLAISKMNGTETKNARPVRPTPDGQPSATLRR